MEKDNPLLPFAFTRANSSEIHLDTTPRSRATIDENAKSIYHTRTPDTKRKPLIRPGFVPNLKRRMGESFNEKDDVKRRVTGFDDVGNQVTPDTGGYDTTGEEIRKKRMIDQGLNSEPPVEPDIDSEEPTMIDTTSDGDHFKIPYSDKENFIVPPSSPPEPHLNSDYDIVKYSIPFSPSQHLNSEQSDYSPTKTKVIGSQRNVSQHQLESETDFGIDKFNRFRPPGNACPSTDRDITSMAEEEAERQKQINLKARDIVIEAFEEIRTSIDLESLGLTEIPHEIKDLNNLVVFESEATQTIYQVYLTNNKIRYLTPALFKFTKINVLVLRQNKIETIPGSIKKLVNLTDLSIGTNRLKYLPYQILELPNLTTFRAGPNPYFPVPSDAITITTATLNPFKTLKYVSKVKFFKYDQEVKQEFKLENTLKVKLVPSLKSICLAKVAKYDVSYQETKEWKRNTPKLFHNLIIQAISHGNFDETCCECQRIIVEPVAEVIEWWDILQNKNIPFKKEFCSGMCAKMYSSRIIEDANYNDL